MVASLFQLIRERRYIRTTLVDRVMGLAADRIEPDRAIRLLGLRAEMPMPDDAREGHTPTRSGW